ncbi:MAG: hypothetical protein A2X94_11010 [Bdellovibrionales bacterium GWB1_55_8]|nr:MAG: hypothetical protein A2X94_11010 [Bdellovibrionales bacterium GWB1_55_8]
MSVYARFKRSPEGFRALVELLESTPLSRRQKMIDVGMQEDAEYTEKALQYVMTFEDIVELPDLQLAEVAALAPPRTTAFAFHEVSEDQKTRLLLNSQPRVRAEIKEYLEVAVGPREIAGAQLKLVETARTLERRGLVRIKKIP